MKTPYLHEINDLRDASARKTVPILMDLFQPSSVVDLGCGLGVWLKVFQDQGVFDVTGIDGPWVDKSRLQIKNTDFFTHDLKQPLTIGRKFDLALCLEVAEHLPESAAETLVESLVNLSDIIVFSAAIPGQGGQNHVNEQWPDYWHSKFQSHGFACYDAIRPLIWASQEISYWYKQNILIFSRFNPQTCTPASLSLDKVVHPENYLEKAEIPRRIIDSKLSPKFYFFRFLRSRISK